MSNPTPRIATSDSFSSAFDPHPHPQPVDRVSLPSNVHLPAHPHILNLTEERRYEDFRCGFCGKNYESGPIYHCDLCTYDCCVSCAVKQLEKQKALEARDLYVGIARELRCPICTNVFCCPMGLPCGHTFCKHCCTRFIEASGECPLCRTKVMRRMPFPLPVLEQLADLIRESATRQRWEELSTHFDLPGAEVAPIGGQEVESMEGITLLSQRVVVAHKKSKRSEEDQRQEGEEHEGSTEVNDDDEASTGPTCALCRLDGTPETIRAYMAMVAKKEPSTQTKLLQSYLAGKPLHLFTEVMGEMCGPYRVPSRTVDGKRVKVERYAHYLCLLWSPQVVIREERLQKCEAAIQAAATTHCYFCKELGATLLCAVRNCGRCFHVTCAHLTSDAVCTLDSRDYCLRCPEHRASM